MTHLSVEELKRWRDSPTDAARARVTAHLAVCDACAAQYAVLLRAEPLTEEPSFSVAAFVERGLRQPLTAAAATRQADLNRRPTSGQFMGWALAAGVLLAVGIGAWQVLNAPPSPSAPALTGNVPQPTAPPTVTSPQPPPSSTGPDAATPRAPALLSLMLVSGRTRGDGRSSSVTLSPDTAELRLVLTVEGPQRFASYQAEVLDANGEAVWKGAAAADASPSAIVTVPARQLRQDDYEVVLRGVTAGGSTERAGSYYFTVLKP